MAISEKDHHEQPRCRLVYASLGRHQLHIQPTNEYAHLKGIFGDGKFFTRTDVGKFLA